MSTKVYAPFTATRRSGAAAPPAGAGVLLLARRRLAHDSVRNAMQLTVTDVAAVELRRKAQHLPAFSHARAWPQHIRESVTQLPLCADKLRLSSAACRNGPGLLISEADPFYVEFIATKVRLTWTAE